MVAFIESHVGYLSLEVRFDCTQGLSTLLSGSNRIGPTFYLCVCNYVYYAYIYILQVLFEFVLYVFCMQSLYILLNNTFLNAINIKQGMSLKRNPNFFCDQLLCMCSLPLSSYTMSYN